MKVALNLNKEQLARDQEISRDLVVQLDKENDILDNAVLEVEDQGFVRLDLQVLYLRNVHHYCYWSGAEFSNHRILLSKCGTLVLRTVQESEPNHWQDVVQQLALKRLARPPRVQFADDLFVDSKRRITKKDQEVFVCDVPDCAKHFVAPHFLLKHLKARHLDHYHAQLALFQEALMFDNFKKETLDKNNITHYATGLAKNRNNDTDKPAHFDQPLNYVPYKGSRQQYRDLDRTGALDQELTA